MNRIKLAARIVRRIPDPLFNSVGTERHIFFVPAEAVPIGIPTAGMLRTVRTRWDIYREAQDALFDRECTPGIFHLKNRGIVAIAKEVSKIDDEEHEVEFGEGGGIIDGMRTYQLIVEAQQQKLIELPAKQFVEFEIWTKVPAEWVGEITRARNTSIQVQGDSLIPLQRAFGWIKEELLQTDYFAQIAWSEYERGGFDIRDVLCLLTCFDVTAYPNMGTKHPVVAYENKALVTASFSEDYKKDNGRAYQKLRPIVKDILSLYDTLALEFPKLAKRYGKKCPELIEKTRGRPFEFTFIGESAPERAARGAVYPLLAAFRWMVEERNGELGWRGGFDAVLARWRAAAERLIELTVVKSRELGGRADALGRSPSHWGALHKEIAFLDVLEQREAPSAPAKPQSAEREVQKER